uniref:Ig-like domain-containing protein n=1 Tax=Leptobrachium leishanense TaxID=445787 RepID=A0A8C5Q457_9ANUR
KDIFTNIILIFLDGYESTFTCKPSGQRSSYIHWYLLKPNEVMKRIGYYSNGNPIYEDWAKRKFIIEASGENYDLTVNEINADDSATYYCAIWDIFGSGTKLIVTSKYHNHSLTIIIIKTEQLIHMCLLQNFFPDVITVTWKKESGDVIESEQGEMRLNDPTKTYSMLSWITVEKSDIGNHFKCNYKHEGVETTSQWESITAEYQQNTGTLLCLLTYTKYSILKLSLSGSRKIMWKDRIFAYI